MPPEAPAEGAAPTSAGTLASDEALAELRRKLTGGDEDAAAGAAEAEAGAEAASDVTETSDAAPDEE